MKATKMKMRICRYGQFTFPAGHALVEAKLALPLRKAVGPAETGE